MLLDNFNKKSSRHKSSVFSFLIMIISLFCKLLN